MQTVWDYSLELETLRLLHNAHHIANGFFRLNGLIILPLEQSASNDNFVTHPDLPYLSIPRFWHHAARINVHSLAKIQLQVPPKFLAQTHSLLTKSRLPTPDTHTLKSLWMRHQVRIMNHIYTLIPSTKNSVRTLTVWPTVFGTNCSFSLCDHTATRHDITVWLRHDQGISALVEAMLTSLTRQSVFTRLGGLWSESEIIVDWLLTYSPLHKLLNTIDPKLEKTLTIRSTRHRQQAKLLQKSLAFLQKIGAPHVSPLHIDTSIFTPAELQFFQLLSSRSPNIVTFDELAPNTENFSLYAISKSIQRLRDKLETQGISGSFIQTKRGEGYLLANLI